MLIKTNVAIKRLFIHLPHITLKQTILLDAFAYMRNSGSDSLFNHVREVFRPSGRPVYRFEHPNYGPQKTLFIKKSFIFSVVFQQKKCRQMRKTMRQRGRSERRNYQRKCFPLFNYVIDHASIRFFFYANSLQLRVISSVLLVASLKL